MISRNLILFILFALSIHSKYAFAQTNIDPLATIIPGYLTDFKYQVANVTEAEAQSLMDTESKDTADNSICANRASVWSYMMNKKSQLKVGKVFIHFTELGQADENGEWAYHVAPYVVVNGVEMVLDGGFGVFNHKPVKLSEWTKYFGKSETCTVLDPSKNSDHLKLEINNLPNDESTPNHFKGGARQYPSENGSICYIRKTPMYYVFPYEVYGADLAIAGDATYEDFVRDAFDDQETLRSCSQALSFWARVKNKCTNYLGIKKQ